MGGYYVVKQQVEPGRIRLVECDKFGCVTVHRTKRGAEAAVAEHGERNGYFVARDHIRRDQAVVDVVE